MLAGTDRGANIQRGDANIGIHVSGTNPVAVRPDYASSNADVNGDGKVGQEEVIYILQKIAGLKE